MKLLKRLFQGGSIAPSPSEGETAEVPVLDPHGGPVYVVGDVHGCLTDYCDLELAILKDAAILQGCSQSFFLVMWLTEGQIQQL